MDVLFQVIISGGIIKNHDIRGGHIYVYVYVYIYISHFVYIYIYVFVQFARTLPIGRKACLSLCFVIIVVNLHHSSVADKILLIYFKMMYLRQFVQIVGMGSSSLLNYSKIDVGSL